MKISPVISVALHDSRYKLARVRPSDPKRCQREPLDSRSRPNGREDEDDKVAEGHFTTPCSARAPEEESSARASVAANLYCAGRSLFE